MNTITPTLSVDARIARAATAGFPVVSRERLRACHVHRDTVLARLEDARLTRAWGDTMLIGKHDIATIPRDLLRRLAVATVEPNAALGGASGLERLAGWERLKRNIVVVSDRSHPDIPAYGITFRQVSDIDRELHEMRDIDGIPTVGALAAIVHAARDLTAHQVANALKAVQHHTGLQVDTVERALAERQRVIGAPRLRRGIELVRSGSAGTKGWSEDHMLPHLVARYGEPLVNVRGCAGMPDYEPDFCWVTRFTIVEIDGPHHMNDPAVKAADEARDAILRAAGWTVIRIPWFWVWKCRDHALRVIERGFCR